MCPSYIHTHMHIYVPLVGQVDLYKHKYDNLDLHAKCLLHTLDICKTKCILWNEHKSTFAF